MELFQKISIETGIPCWRIKLAMGISLKECKAETLADAVVIAFKSEIDSEEEYCAFLKWQELVIKQINETDNFSKLCVLNNTLPDEGISKRTLIKRMIAIAKSPEELLSAYSYSQKGSFEEKEVMELLIAQGNKGLLLNLYFNTAMDSSLRQSLVEKITRFY